MKGRSQTLSVEEKFESLVQTMHTIKNEQRVEKSKQNHTVINKTKKFCTIWLVSAKIWHSVALIEPLLPTHMAVLQISYLWPSQNQKTPRKKNKFQISKLAKQSESYLLYIVFGYR